ncbi:hypothetical protein ACVRWL_03055 [Streptococcus ratti]|uniref:hypothetical protein n=1 Tax=Streptococcus ratti TaxID=1341 RepID=UPI0031B573A9
MTSGRYQIAVNNLAKNVEREKNYLFSNPMFENPYVVTFKIAHLRKLMKSTLVRTIRQRLANNQGGRNDISILY